MPIYTIDAELLRCADIWRAQGDEPTMKKYAEFNLDTVRIEPRNGGAVVVATCAQAMFVGFDKHGTAPAPANLRVPKGDFYERLGHGLRVVYGRGPVMLMKGQDVEMKAFGPSEDYMITGKAAKYPNWFGSLPTEQDYARANPVMPSNMNADFLGRLGDMFNGWLEHRQLCFSTTGKTTVDPDTKLPTSYRNIMVHMPWMPNAFVMFAPWGGSKFDHSWAPFPYWLKDDPAAGL